MADDSTGKKVFILYPPSVIQENMIQILVRSEFEVYLLHDHQKTARLVKKYQSPILYINIDKNLSEEDWEEYIRFLMEGEDTKDVQIGIITYNEDKALARKYLMDIGVHCGFVRLKLGLEESAKIIIKTLLAVEARGKRRHVRAPCADRQLAYFNVVCNDKIYPGNILDISIAGMACVFDEEVPRKFAQGAVVEDIQLRLRGQLTKINGRIVGNRSLEDGTTIYVVLFDTKLSSHVKSRIHNFIRKELQDEIDKQLLTV